MATQELQRGLTSIAALMPARMGADDGSATVHVRQRPAAARALRCIAAAHNELQVRLPADTVLLCCAQHCILVISCHESLTAPCFDSILQLMGHPMLSCTCAQSLREALYQQTSAAQAADERWCAEANARAGAEARLLHSKAEAAEAVQEQQVAFRGSASNHVHWLQTVAERYTQAMLSARLTDAAARLFMHPSSS